MPVTIPSRAAISCNTIAENTEKATAHNNDKPYSAPALLAIKTVPGPMKAAVTRIAGPKSVFLEFPTSGLFQRMIDARMSHFDFDWNPDFLPKFSKLPQSNIFDIQHSRPHFRLNRFMGSASTARRSADPVANQLPSAIQVKPRIQILII